MVRPLVSLLILTGMNPVFGASDAALRRMAGVQARRWREAYAIPYRGTPPLPGSSTARSARWNTPLGAGPQAVGVSANQQRVNIQLRGYRANAYRPFAIAPPIRRIRGQ